MYFLTFFTLASSSPFSTPELIQSSPGKAIIAASGMMKSKKRMGNGQTEGEANPHNGFLSLLRCCRALRFFSSGLFPGLSRVFWQSDLMVQEESWVPVGFAPLLKHSRELSGSSVDSCYNHIGRQQAQGAFWGIRALVLAGCEEPL